jgi:hypothetical protein
MMSEHSVERYGPTEMVLRAMYKYPLNAIGFIVLRMFEILQEVGNQEALEAARKARTKFERASELRYDWEQTKNESPVTNEGAQAIDDEIDVTLTHLKKGAETFTALKAQTEEKELAEEFLDELFAEGVYPITSQPFAEQYTTVRHLLQRLNGRFAEHVEKLNLTTLVDQLEELNQQFADAIKFDVEQVTYDEVQAAEAEAEEAFHKMLIRVMCDYKDDLETFHQIMAPLHEQRARMKRLLKDRANVPPIDPESGEPRDPNEGLPEEPDNEGQNDGGSPENDGGSPENDDSTNDDNSESDGQSPDNDSTEENSDGENESDGETSNN